MTDGWYTNPQRLEEEIAKHGSIRAAARANDVSEAVLRKWRGGRNIPALKALPSMEEPVETEEKLRHQLAQARRELRKYRERQVEVELIADRVLEHVKAATPRYRAPALSRLEVGRAKQTAVLLEGDFHASEVVRPDEVWGMNAYDWDVMLERMTNVQESTLSHTNHAGFETRELVIALLGDMTSGDIHEELAITNDRPAAAAIVDLAHDLSEHIAAFVPHFESIRVVGVPGNHPRLSKKPTAKMAYNNGDWLCYAMIEKILARYETIRCEFPRAGFQIVTVEDRWRLGLMHGDGIRSTMPGVPWGGISRRVASLMEQANAAQVAIDYLACGHFHTANALDGVVVETFMNGSLKGVDEYSLKQFGGGRSAKQRLLFFHRRHGVTGMHWINLQPAIPMTERRAA